MKKIIKEISQNKNLEMNLPVYANYIFDLYYKYACIEMTMDYYTYYEMMEDISDEEIIALTKNINEIINKHVLIQQVDENRESSVIKINEIRNIIFKKVDILSSYADIFSRYEYISNRCEYIFDEPDMDSNYDDENFTREIMQYIFSDEDNSLINAKISDIIAELPLRLTKNKFFELLNEGLSVYKKTDKDTIDDFIYVLRSSAMLRTPEEISEGNNDGYFEELEQIRLSIKSIDFKNITKDIFMELEQKLRYASEFIEKLTTMYTMLQNVVNKAYVILLAAPYTADDKITDCCKQILKEIGNSFENEEYQTLPDEISDKFVFLEGMPEELHSKISSCEFVLDTVKKDYLGVVKSLMEDKIYLGLFISQNLLSDSLFIDLTKVINIFNIDKDETDEAESVEVYLNQQRDKFILELTEFFKNNQKMVNKSVMAAVLSRLPVFLNNITEVQDYVYNSLSNSVNKAEKPAAVIIVKSIMEN